MFALLVHQVVGDAHRRLDQHLARAAARALFFDLAQDRQRQVIIRTDQAGAVAMRAGLGGGLDHAGAQALARHFQQAKPRDTAHLNARAIGFQLVFQALFNGCVVLALVHIDEIDHDQTGQIAQAQLACHLFGGLDVGFQRRLFDRALFRGAPRVHIDGHQCLGHADHDIATRFQLNHRVEHRAEVAFHLETGEQRQGFAVLFHIHRMRGHDHFHEIFGNAIAALALDQHLVDIAAV